MHADPCDRPMLGTARADERMVFGTRDAKVIAHAGPLMGDLLLEA